MQQLPIPGSTVDQPIKFVLHACEYHICNDLTRYANSKPSWYVLRIHDLAVTERYYSAPDGAFGAVYHQRCSWRRD